jgi:ubiquitin-conjugating enzyme E2 J2
MIVALDWVMGISDLPSSPVQVIVIDWAHRFQYCTPSRRHLPNMGEKERGTPDTPEPTPEPSESTTPTARLPLISPPKVGLVTQSQVAAPKTAGVVRPRKGRAVSTTGAGDGSRGWAATWRQVVWDKWRWGVVIALAVVVSRITTTT